MDDGDLFDYAESARRRDEGMDLVAKNNPTFAYQYYHAILALPLGWVGNNEDIVRDWTGVQPKHPNAWGSCFGHAKRKGLLTELPDRRPNEGVKAHARRQNLYIRVKPHRLEDDFS
jgi:hypothetical protein